ncbi:MAG: glycosyltransferase family 39 protein [Patescibacteria group bacterium]
MFKLAIVIGIYSYLIFSLGIFNLLSKTNVILTTIIYLSLVSLYLIKTNFFYSININLKNFSNLSKLILFLIVSQAAINLIGVFGPEISFDSLWYHLTLPKLYLENQNISHFPGIVLYYSNMPKLIEMLYVGALSFDTEILAKLIHFIFGLLILVVIYKLSRKFISVEYSLIAALIFYSNLVVGWLSISSYVDLARTFFEVLSVFAFILFTKNNDRKYLLLSALILGLAITTKLVSIFSLGIFIILFILAYVNNRETLEKLIKNIFAFIFVSLCVPAPWFIFSYLNTGNPFYPYFSIPVDGGSFINIPNLISLPKDILMVFVNTFDPISPLYLVFIPLLIMLYKKTDIKVKYLFIYSLIAFFLWYLTQYFRGTRFLLPYLPIFSILCAYAISMVKEVNFKKYLILLVIFISIVSIGYRGFANAKYIQLFLGSETKNEFLRKNLNFNFGDFYDTDDYFKNNIKRGDKVLLYGFHNLYYVDFPFIEGSSAKKGDKFNYIAVQNANLPVRFSDWKEIYYNKETNVRFYKLNNKLWEY